MHTKHYHQFQLGAFTCTAIQDDAGAVPAESIFSTMTEAERAVICTRYSLDPTAIWRGQTCLLVETGQQRVLIDTGGGIPLGDDGQLIPILRSLGVEPSTIDVVILSHGHADHYGGLLNATGGLNYPHARHVMWRKEWEHWTTPARLAAIEQDNPARAEMLRDYLLPIAGIVELVDDEAEIVTGIRPIPAYGHTAGHIALSIESQGQTLLYLADAVLHPVFLENRAWQFARHEDPIAAQQSKDALFDRAASTEALALAYHFPFPSLGTIHTAEDGHRWQPIEASKV